MKIRSRDFHFARYVTACISILGKNGKRGQKMVKKMCDNFKLTAHCNMIFFLFVNNCLPWLLMYHSEDPKYQLLTFKMRTRSRSLGVVDFSCANILRASFAAKMRDSNMYTGKASYSIKTFNCMWNWILILPFPRFVLPGISFTLNLWKQNMK